MAVFDNEHQKNAKISGSCSISDYKSNSTVEFRPTVNNAGSFSAPSGIPTTIFSSANSNAGYQVLVNFSILVKITSLTSGSAYITYGVIDAQGAVLTSITSSVTIPVCSREWFSFPQSQLSIKANHFSGVSTFYAELTPTVAMDVISSALTVSRNSSHNGNTKNITVRGLSPGGADGVLLTSTHYRLVNKTPTDPYVGDPFSLSEIDSDVSIII